MKNFWLLILFCACLSLHSQENKDCKVNIPDSVNAHNDGSLYIQLNCQLSDFKFQIYDRWGELLYDAKPDKDGRCRWPLDKIAEGVYVWLLEYKVSGDKEKTKKIGHIRVTR